MLFLRLSFFILTALLAFTGNAISGTVRYVKDKGTGDGSSWDKASGNLQTVIDLSAAGDQIWIAEGTYMPAINGSFSLTKNLEIYGGFPDSGIPDFSNRDKTNFTVLKANGADIFINSSAVTQATILDGLTFTGTQSSIAMINDGASPLVRNCLFKDNSASNGAGVYNKSTSKAIFSNCIFQNNAAVNNGGAMLNTDDADVQLSNCIFVNNNAPYGPGISAQSRSKTLIVNCTFFGNGGRGAVTLVGSSYVSIYNSILWGEAEEGISRYNSSVFELRYSICRTGAGGNVLNTDPLFVNTANLEGEDGIWGTADDGLRLQMNSPAISTGDPLTNTADYLAQAGMLDFNGHTRVFDSRVDMGAYEYPKKKQIMTLPGTPVGSTYYVYGTYGSGPIDLPKVTSTSGNIQYSLPANNGRVTIVDGKIHIKNAGATTLTITSAGDETYDPITKTMTISIARKPLSLAPNPDNPLVKTYDGSDFVYLHNVSNFVFTGVLPGDDVYPKFEYVYAYFLTPNVGSNLTLMFDQGLIRTAGASAGNYSYRQSYDDILNAGSIVPKPIVITANALSKVYGEADPELTYSLPDKSLVGSDKITGSLSREAGEDAGTYAIKQNTITSGDNYEITYKGADLTIDKAPATISLRNLMQTFDGSAKFVTAETSPANLSGITITYSGLTTPPVDAGTYSVVAKLDNLNYTAADATGTLQIEAVLPVILKKFTVKALVNHAKIEWQTNGEQQNSYFEVERSGDGLHFDMIGTIPGGGTSSAVLDYQLLDQAPLNGPNYYRLKQIDMNGMVSTLGTQLLRFQLASPVSVVAYPIPLNDNSLNVVFKNYTGKQVKVSLVEMGGKIVHSEFINLVNDATVHKLNLGRKPVAGQYVLFLQGEGLKSAIKIMVQ
ncbi:MBG domain-containing protein [Desertivirga xinjiangensis]|uniref:MBG domain-containing protein n=1 Tax=Desertivirga xinjiangensis TaxID=539206 RepID=UPI00210CD820|nr:MBG domain-containing protein [Pedobacter xinjiangensis]